MEYILKTKGLTKRYGLKCAVDNVDMSIKEGEIYGFIGKNGAGKTTFMRLVLGTAPADRGKIELFDGMRLSSARRRIGSLLEYPCLYKNCTAYDNLERLAVLTNSDDKEIKHILKLVGLEDTGTKRVKDFSLGMKQRLGIGVALLGNPEFLVLDEPINGLDPTGIKEVRDIIHNLNTQYGVTFLISSHLLDELAKIVTTYGIISNGKLIEQVGAEELKARCSNQLRILVDKPEKAALALSAIVKPEDIIVDVNTLYINSAQYSSSKINAHLIRCGVNVHELFVDGDSFEEYFIERLGK